MQSDNFHSATIPNDRLLPGIHGLRGIAALAIVLYHLHHMAGINVPEAFQFIGRDFGYGAHMFFVLSAFSLMYSTEHTMNRSRWAVDYFIKRFFRIGPLFYFIIAFELVRQAATHGVVANIPTILLNVFFVFGFNPSSGIVMGGWTVGVEMIFYVLLPFLLLKVRTTRSALLFLFAALVISSVSRYLFHEQYLKEVPLALYDWWGYFSFVPNLFFFAIGIYAFKLKNELTKESITTRLVAPLIAVVTISVLLLTEGDILLRNNSGRPDLIIWAIGFGALCIWQSTRPSFWSANKIFKYAGERSYSIYLLHPIIILFSKSYILKFYNCLSPYIGAYAFFICALIVLGILFIAAEITYRMIEVPGIKLGRNIIRRLPSAKLIWDDDLHLKINDVNFYLSCDTEELQCGKSSKENFLLGKPKQSVEKAVAIGQQERINKIFEMGILHGGSVVLYDQIFQPKKIVAIEFSAKPVDALASYIANHSKADIVKPYYGINQSDRSAMETILAADFPDRDIDLIIDDASHLYDETREAFNISFPYLKKGGIYIIEDWAWAHWSGEYWQKDNEYFSGRKALSNLLIELFMLTASRPDFIKDISIEPSVITVRRGDGALPVGKFDIADHYLLRGKHFDTWL